MRKQNKRKRHIVTLLILLAIIVFIPFILYSSTKSEESKDTEKEAPKPAPLIIDIPKPCNTGTVTVYGNGEVLYQYAGVIIIKNDGINGKSIEIVVEYPEEFCLPSGTGLEEGE